MRLVFGEDQHVAAWTARRIPHMGEGGFVAPYTAIGVVDDTGAPVAGVIYNTYNPMAGTLEVSMAASSPRWARKGVIKALLFYPFEQLGVRKLFAVLPHTNERALKFIQGIGFKREATLARQFGSHPHVHAVIVRMFSEDYSRLYQQPKTAAHSASNAATARPPAEALH